MNMRVLRTTLLTLVLSAAQAAGQFSLPEVIAAGEEKATGLSDIDGDGLLDMVGGRTWWRNLGGGEFAPPLRAIPEYGIIPTAMLDVSGNGMDDLVVARSDGSIVAYSNQGGTFAGTGMQIGTWMDATANPQQQEPNRILGADVNNDGFQDLLVTFPYNPGIWCFDNDGNGGFGTRRTLQGSLINLVDLVVTDLNGDGYVDLVYSLDNTGFDRIEAKLNLGNGFFAAPVVIDNAQNQLQYLAVRDVTNDGIVDLVYTKLTALSLVYREGAGNGTFGPEVVLVQGIPPARFFKYADMDGDGVEDGLIGSLNQETVTFYPGLGDNVFGDPIVVAQYADNMTQMETGDLDNDGDLDLLLTWDFSAVLWNSAAGSVWQREIRSVLSGFSEKQYADLDQDGDKDLILLYTSYEAHGCIVWHPREGASFGPRRIIVADVLTLARVRAADMDGDGMTDLVYLSEGIYNQVNGRILWVRNLGGGLFAEPVQIQSNFTIQNFDLGDLDGDGDVDMISCRQSSSIQSTLPVVYLNNGSGALSLASTTGLPTSATMSRLADVDGDGHPDLIREGYPFRWWRNNGGTNYTTMPQVGALGPGPFRGLRLWDVDGDGLKDVVYGSNNVIAFRSLGGGVFASTGVELLATNTGFIHTADIDGDGLEDMVTIGDQNGVLWYHNPGTGALDPMPHAIHTGGAFYGYNSSEFRREMIVIDDIDGNGLDDLIFTYAEPDEPRQVVLVRNYTGQVGLSGRCYADMDQDGEFNNADVPAPWLPVAVSPVPSVPYTGANGIYNYWSPSGTYTLTLGGAWPTAFWGVGTGADGYTVEVVDAAITGLDFALVPLVDSSQVEVTIVQGTAPCGTPNVIWLALQNQGTRVEQGTVSLTLDPLFTYLGSNIPPSSITGNTLHWEVDQLNMFGTWSIPVTVMMPSVQDIGAAFQITAVFSTEGVGGGAGQQFQGQLVGTVACAYDPNDKQVEPEGFGVYGAIDVGTEGLTYTIRFQNTGTAPAQDVELHDALPALVDPMGLHVVAYSHTPTSFSVDGQGKLIVRFAGIMLPDSGSSMVESQGFIRFAAALAGGGHLDAVENTAEIYFDVNPAIVTNTVLNTLVDCDLWTPQAVNDWNGSITASEGIAYQWYLNGVAIPNANGQTVEVSATGAYQAEVTSVYGCVAFTDTAMVISLGHLVLEDEFALLFPNPFSEDLHVQLKGGTAIKEAFLCDMSGCILRRMQGQRGNLVMPREGLAQGLYLLSITTTDGAVKVFRVVAQ